VGIIVFALLVLILFHRGRKTLGVRESPILAQLLPSAPHEKGVFALLSVAAGVGEELTYRAYVIPVLALLLGSPWGAAALSSVAFGVLHAYQGWLGVLRTAVLGFLLAASFLVSGSLWPAVLAHTILDLLGGLVLGEALVTE
jgi:membrane protease YdiL (CAAX protease family)